MEARSTETIWRIVAVVRGRVQGVGFRYFIRTAAMRLDVNGWVRNESDGSVRVVAEGSPDKLRHLINAMHTGPSLASVKSVDVDWSESVKELDGFNIDF